MGFGRGVSMEKKWGILEGGRQDHTRAFHLMVSRYFLGCSPYLDENTEKHCSPPVDHGALFAT